MPASNVPWGPVLTRVPTIFPGQPGVPGTDSDRGLRLDTNGIILYVDPNHVDNNDLRDGTNPTAPLSTVAAALTRCRAYRNDTIVVAPSSYWVYDDTIVGRATPIREEVTVEVPGVRIVGLIPSGVGVPWVPVTDSGACITVHAMSVLIEGFRFWNGDNVATPTAINAAWGGTPAVYGESLTVRHCAFDGHAFTLNYGILFDFTYNVHVHDCQFINLAVAGLHSQNVEGDMLWPRIHDNWFNDNIAAIDLEETEYAEIFRNSIVGDPTVGDSFIDLNGVGNRRNLVYDNWLGCSLAQYAGAGGTCRDGGAGTDAWVNNHCIDGDTVANP